LKAALRAIGAINFPNFNTLSMKILGNARILGSSAFNTRTLQMTK
jgi:hypothetical protein